MNKLLLLAPITLSLVGCSANSLTNQGQHVVILKNLPSQYQCTYKGEIAGSQGNWLTGYWTPNKNIALGARNDLRNEAAELGANVVIISETLNATDDSLELKNITHIGRAYLCRR